MSFLSIKNAPLKTSIVGDEKIPTGGYGDLAITVQQIKDFTALAFSNVDNISDLDKPISTATQAALNLKANVSDVNTALALKSDKTYVNDQLALKASKIYVDTELQKTASKTYVDNQLATKASTTYVDSINSTKASISYVDSELALKSDITYVDSVASTKADKATTLSGYGITNAYTKTEVDSSITAVAGGHKAYQTLADAQAAQASLPANTVVEVTNDVTTSNNGTYQWNGTTLTKSAYDPLTQAKAYTDTEIDAIGVEQGLGTEISVAIIDANDNRTWLEADIEGKPTTYSKSLILEKIDPEVSTKVQTEVTNAGIEQIASPDMAVAIIDANDNRTWLEADTAGKPTQYSADCIIEVINFNDVAVPSKFKSAYQLAESKIASGPDIVCWGDSMTAGAGGNGTTYPSVLKTLLQNAGSTANTHNMGVGGETSVTICARQGGNPFLINVTGGIIPADTSPVTVTLEQIDGQTVRPLLQGAGTFTGYLGDVHGTLNLVEPSGNSATWQADNYYTFTRTTAGSEITLNRPIPFYLDVATPRLGDIHIIWIGQNGPSTARAISDAKAMINKMQALDKRYLVISKPTSTDADDSLFFAEFGRRFVAARKYLVQYGLQDAGITPTTQDDTDIANGVVPTSLRSDAVHWNAQGYTILANLLFNRIKELGWI